MGNRIQDWKVWQQLTSSDHNVISYTTNMEGNQIEEIQQEVKKYNKKS